MVVSQMETMTGYELKSFTTLKIGGNADIAYFPVTVGDMVDCIKKHALKNEKYTVIGAGSIVKLSQILKNRM